MFQPVAPVTPIPLPKRKYLPMLKGSDLIGKPVTTHNTQATIGEIEDLIFDYTSNQVIAFVIDKPGWRRNARIIPWSGIESISTSGLVAWSNSMVVVANQLYRVKQILDRDNLVKGMPVITDDGRHLGVKTDFFFSEQTGAIQGYELKGGIFAGSDTDCSFIPLPPSLQLSKNAAYVPARVVQQMEESSQTMNGLSQEAELALGHRARRAVRTDTGSLIVAVGQIITDGALVLAHSHGKGQELLQAAGVEPGNAK